MALPFKIGTLLLRTLAKPVATNIKTQAQAHPRIRQSCIHLGNFLNSTTSRLEVRLLGHHVKQIKPLPDSQAVAKGADFIGETFIFAVGAVVVLWEYRRQAKDRSAAAQDKARRAETKRKIVTMRFEAVEKELGYLAQHIAILETSLRKHGVEIPDLPNIGKLSDSPSASASNRVSESSAPALSATENAQDKYDLAIREQASRLRQLNQQLLSILRSPGQAAKIAGCKTTSENENCNDK